MDNGRLLALDVGDRRIGVAVSDPLRILARPVTTIQRRAAADVQAVVDLIAEWDVAQLVVGLPLLPSGDRGEQARAVEAFVRRLEAAVAIPIVLWDESYTTETAAERLRARGVAARAAKALIDAEAAAVILEEWLRAHAEPVEAAEAPNERARRNDAPSQADRRDEAWRDVARIAGAPGEAAHGDEAPRETVRRDEAPRETVRRDDVIE